jgi:hypothetical protein
VVVWWHIIHGGKDVIESAFLASLRGLLVDLGVLGGLGTFGIVA